MENSGENQNSGANEQNEKNDLWSHVIA